LDGDDIDCAPFYKQQRIFGDRDTPQSQQPRRLRFGSFQLAAHYTVARALGMVFTLHVEHVPKIAPKVG
jgi:hypothetical protein